MLLLPSMADRSVIYLYGYEDSKSGDQLASA